MLKDTIMSLFTSQLRTALSTSKDAKDASREAGQGVWANYVRSICYGNTLHNAEDVSTMHKSLVEELDSLRELTKEEKNSLRSAKCVVSKAVTNNVDVWQRTEIGDIVEEDGLPMPKGKSELSEAKTDFQRMVGFIDQAQAKYDSDGRDDFTKDELKAMADKYAALANSLIEELQAQNMV